MTNVNRRRFITIMAGITAGFALPVKALAQKKLFRWQGIAMGSYADIQLYHPVPEFAEKLVNQCVKEIKRLENIFTLYDNRSALSRLNNEGVLKNPPAEMKELIETAKYFGYITQGGFDITVQPLWNLYKKHFVENKTPPANSKIEEVLKLVDYRKIEISGAEIKYQKTGMAVTLNGIAQGYITDKVTALLRENGIKEVLVNIGEMSAIGGPWNIGIKDTNEFINLNNKALATSGGYGTKFTEDGKYHHLLDTKTGRPTDIYQSVSVISDNATTADALSTSISSMFPEDALNVLNTTSSGAIFVLKDGDVIRHSIKETG